MSTSDHFSALPAGARVRDYAIERVLGSGGFGITYKALEAITERAVAIKEFLPAALAARERDGHSVRPLSEGARQDFEWGLSRFRQEAKVLIGLKHPNIVPVLSYFEANGTGYLVMEFEDGTSLGQMLGAEGVLSEKALLAYLAPLLDGLECVHRAGFLHRDIKPDNIFIRRDGVPVLIDFGAARQALGQHSKSLTAVLTEGYAPYEQYERDGDQGPWTDIYALGAVMYRCLAGKRPIEAPKRIAALVRNAPDPLAADLTALRGLASRHIADAIAAALGTTESVRPQSVGAFRALIAGARHGAAPAVPPDHTLIPGTMAGKPQRWEFDEPSQPRKRRRALPVYLAIGAVLIAGVAAGGYVIVESRERATQQTAAATQLKAEEERKRAEEARAKAEAEAEAKRRAEEEQRTRQEAERKRLEDERAKNETEAKRKAEEDRRAKEEADRKRSADERAKADEERKRRAEQDAARKAGPAAESTQQLRLFGDIFERVRSSYVDDVGEKRLVAAAVEAMLKSIGSPASGTWNDQWRKDLDRASGSSGALDVFGREFARAHASHAARFGGYRLVHKVIDGMLQALDPHSSYMDADTFREMQVQNRGEFGGLGMEVTLDKDLVKVVSPIDDTPAAKAGIQAGDYITHIDGQSVEGWSLKEAIDKLRGVVNTNVTIRIKRGEKDAFDVTLTRAVITVKSVRSRTEGNIGIIRITSFTERTDTNLREALAAFRTNLGSKWEGVILDLRNNPGGLLDQAISVADEFLDQGEILSTRGRGDNVTGRWNAKRGDGADGKPVIILINKGSASASEIVAGALQEHRRAVVLGITSFGKGSVQTIIPISDQGAMRLTTARYYRPYGRPIDKIGIVPDIVVDGDPAGSPDVQMERALKWFSERKR